jgi:hypothetical protein
MRNIVYCENRDFYLKIVFHMLRILNFKHVDSNYYRLKYSANINNAIYKFYYYPEDTSKTIMLKVNNMLVADSTVIRKLAKLLGYE